MSIELPFTNSGGRKFQMLIFLLEIKFNCQVLLQIGLSACFIVSSGYKGLGANLKKASTSLKSLYWKKSVNDVAKSVRILLVLSDNCSPSDFSVHENTSIILDWHDSSDFSVHPNAWFCGQAMCDMRRDTQLVAPNRRWRIHPRCQRYHLGCDLAQGCRATGFPTNQRSKMFFPKRRWFRVFFKPRENFPSSEASDFIEPLKASYFHSTDVEIWI